MQLKLCDFIDINKLDWDMMSTNESIGAVHLLEQNISKVNWYLLSRNPKAIRLLKQNPDKIVWSQLSRNPAAIHILEQNPEKVDVAQLVCNPAAKQMIRLGRIEIGVNAAPIDPEYPDREGLQRLCGHISPLAMSIIEARMDTNSDEIMWSILSANPAATHIIKKELHRGRYGPATLSPPSYARIDWKGLSRNPSAEAMEIIKEYLAYTCAQRWWATCSIFVTLDWSALSANPLAIDILRQNPSKINWRAISANPAIFEHTTVYGRDDDRPECVVCLDNDKSMVCSPCGHYAICQSCQRMCKGVCPLCRNPIVKLVNVADILDIGDLEAILAEDDDDDEPKKISGKN